MVHHSAVLDDAEKIQNDPRHCLVHYRVPVHHRTVHQVVRERVYHVPDRLPERHENLNENTELKLHPNYRRCYRPEEHHKRVESLTKIKIPERDDKEGEEEKPGNPWNYLFGDLSEGVSQLGQFDEVSQKKEKVERGKDGGADEKSGRVGEVVVVEGSEQVEVYFEVVENVCVEAHKPDEINEVEKAPPDGEGPFEVIVGCEVDAEVYDNEDYSGHYQYNGAEPEAEKKWGADGLNAGDFDQVPQLPDCSRGRNVVFLRVVQLDLSPQTGHFHFQALQLVVRVSQVIVRNRVALHNLVEVKSDVPQVVLQKMSLQEQVLGVVQVRFLLYQLLPRSAVRSKLPADV